MSRRHNLDTDRHRSNRSVLRIIGPLVLVAGIGLTVVGIGGFFLGAIGVMEEPPSNAEGIPSVFKVFFLAFLGIPMTFVGIVLTKFAYLGAVARYVASEAAPVGKDVTNYVIDGTKDAVGGLAQSVGAGIAAGMAGNQSSTETVDCPSCGAACDSGARFCSDCGTAIPGEVRCERCGAMNEPDAKFCNQCGRSTGV